MNNILFPLVIVLLMIVALSGCTSQPKAPAAPVVYGYAWMEQHQQDVHDACVADVIKRAPRDSSREDLQRFLFECLKANGQAI